MDFFSNRCAKFGSVAGERVFHYTYSRKADRLAIRTPCAPVMAPEYTQLPFCVVFRSPTNNINTFINNDTKYTNKLENVHSSSPAVPVAESKQNKLLQFRYISHHTARHYTTARHADKDRKLAAVSTGGRRLICILLWRGTWLQWRT